MSAISRPFSKNWRMLQALPGESAPMQALISEEIIALPEPRHDGPVSVERALLARRSVRKFSTSPLLPAELSQLLWSAQGISSPRGYRTAPSAGALYPLEVYALTGSVENLPAGIYRYIPATHALARTAAGDLREAVCRAALHQSSIAKAPVVLLFCSVHARLTGKYGERGMGYIYMEIGHAAQNVCLQAVALGLGTVVIGAFHDDDVKAIAGLARDEHPMYIVPIGR